MKIKRRLAIAFVTITVVPLILIYLMFLGLSTYQMESFQKAYGLTEQVDMLAPNSVQIFNRLTQENQQSIREMLTADPEQFRDPAVLDKVNQGLRKKYAYLVVREGDRIIYSGSREDAPLEELPAYGDGADSLESGIYLDGESQHLVKQEDFQFEDGEEGTVFIVSGLDDLIPEVKSMLLEILFFGVLILICTGMILTYWIYQSLLKPLSQLQKATNEIKNGNLDFALDIDNDGDEIGQLCQDFEEMRIRLKETTEEKAQYDKDNRELISNISHDLKTPITSIKGYVEGIMDGVASSPEKLDKYIRTIYNKANDMDRTFPMI